MGLQLQDRGQERKITRHRFCISNGPGSSRATLSDFSFQVTHEHRHGKCGDASNTAPVLARLAEAAPNLEIRLVKPDENPDLMDAHLTDGVRTTLEELLDVAEQPA